MKVPSSNECQFYVVSEISTMHIQFVFLSYSCVQIDGCLLIQYGVVVLCTIPKNTHIPVSLK